jgi:hypothetical protein
MQTSFKIVLLFSIFLSPSAGADFTLDRLESLIGKNQDVASAPDIYPGLPKKLTFGDLDCEINYGGCAEHSFFLTVVDSSQQSVVQAKIDKIAAVSAFNCVSRIAALQGKQSQYRCRFVRQYDLSLERTVPDVFQLPSAWRQALGNREIDSVWFAASVRIGANGIPLELGENVCPVAVRSQADLYLTQDRCEDWFPTGLHAEEHAIVGQKVFTLSSAADVAGSAQRAVALFLQELENNFKMKPLFAQRALDIEAKEGEWVAERIRQKSAVIGRESWLPPVFNSAYETSTYTLKWFCAEGRTYVGAGMLAEKGCGGGGRNVYVDLTHLVYFSSDGVTYHDTVQPDGQLQRYLSLYKAAIADAFKDALVATCYARLQGHGMLSNGTCEIRGDVR